MQDDELACYRVPASGKEVRTRCIERHHLLIRDVYVSDAAFKPAWPLHSAQQRAFFAASKGSA